MNEVNPQAAGAFGRADNREVFGWLSPRGNFYQADLFGHIEAVGKSPELKRLVPNFDEEVADLERQRQYKNDLIDQGEHPEWHTYEMAEDDFKHSIIHALYANGCLRVGSNGSYMHFEGSPQAIKSLFQKAKDLAEEYGKAPAFDPMQRW